MKIYWKSIVALILGFALVWAMLVVPWIIRSACAYGPINAAVIRVVDGDTVELEFDLWPGLTQRSFLRVVGVNAPEIRTQSACEKEAGLKAKAFVEEWLSYQVQVQVVEIDHDKYGGRVVGDIVKDGRHLSKALLEAGLARPYSGQEAKQPWCEDV